MKERRIALEALLIFAAFFFPGFLAQSGGIPQTRDITQIMVSALAQAVPQTLLILYILYLQMGRRLEAFGIVGFKPRDLLRVLLVYLGALSLVVPTAAIVGFLPETARETASQGYRWGLESAAELPLALVFCIVSAYREELFFRAYLLTRLTEIGAAPLLAAAATALLFSAGHLYEGWIGLLFSALQGIYFAAVFFKTRNLHVIALSHGLYNFTVFCLTLALGRIVPVGP